MGSALPSSFGDNEHELLALQASLVTVEGRLRGTRDGFSEASRNDPLTRKQAAREEKLQDCRIALIQLEQAARDVLWLRHQQDRAGTS